MTFYATLDSHSRRPRSASLTAMAPSFWKSISPPILRRWQPGLPLSGRSSLGSALKRGHCQNGWFVVCSNMAWMLC